jgi:hypothetical protein
MSFPAMNQNISDNVKASISKFEQDKLNHLWKIFQRLEWRIHQLSNLREHKTSNKLPQNLNLKFTPSIFPRAYTDAAFQRRELDINRQKEVFSKALRDIVDIEIEHYSVLALEITEQLKQESSSEWLTACIDQQFPPTDIANPEGTQLPRGLVNDTVNNILRLFEHRKFQQSQRFPIRNLVSSMPDNNGARHFRPAAAAAAASAAASNNFTSTQLDQSDAEMSGTDEQPLREQQQQQQDQQPAWFTAYEARQESRFVAVENRFSTIESRLNRRGAVADAQQPGAQRANSGRSRYNNNSRDYNNNRQSPSAQSRSSFQTTRGRTSSRSSRHSSNRGSRRGSESRASDRRTSARSMSASRPRQQQQQQQRNRGRQQQYRGNNASRQRNQSSSQRQSNRRNGN